VGREHRDPLLPVQQARDRAPGGVVRRDAVDRHDDGARAARIRPRAGHVQRASGDGYGVLGAERIAHPRRNLPVARVAATTSTPPAHGIAAITGGLADPPWDSVRSASATCVTGCAFANVRSQCGIVAVSVNAELANTSGNVSRKPAIVAPSTLRTSSPS